MRRAAHSAHPVETGGVLLGVYVEGDRPWVVEAVELPSDAATGTSYEVGHDARPQAVDEARRRDPRLGYLGDWHSHPADLGPSTVDVATMRRLSTDPVAACPHPLLIVVRRSREDGCDLDARQFGRWRLRQVQLVLAGGLPRLPIRPLAQP